MSAVLAILAAIVVLAGAFVAPASAAPAPIRGGGSSYVALAMTQWTADATTNGLSVNYTSSGSPQGLTTFGQSLIDFAGTEAEFSALSAVGGEATRGYQYVPSVAGAVAVMYNVNDAAGRPVDYLHLSRRTVARIFMGDITRWSDPAISTDNLGLVLPDQPINVVYRGGQSGTTGLFYDFVANTAPDIFGPWATRNQLRTDVRIIELDGAPNFAPKKQAFNSSDQIAQHTASASGLWSIAYDEFGYAKVFGANSAWIENAAGQWVLPYAQNISAALESARLRPDLSQELADVYNSPNPEAYPISAYSYIVTQCEAAGDRPTCKGGYTNPGVTETLALWLRYIACDGQVNMAQIGYSPLPPALSQEVANSIARMQGSAPETLTADNCANPRFRGSLGSGASSPPNPLEGVTSIGPGPSREPQAETETATGPGAAGSSGPAAATGPTSATTLAGDTAAEVGVEEELAVGRTGGAKAIGGSTSWKDPDPVLYLRPDIVSSQAAPVILLLLVLVIPAVLLGRRRSSGRR